MSAPGGGPRPEGEASDLTITSALHRTGRLAPEGRIKW